MKSFTTSASALLLSIILLLSLTACRNGVVEIGAPGPDGYYDYNYYPDSEVYYHPGSSIYFWNDHGNWNHGRDLPHNYNIAHENAVPLHLQTAHPYEQHAQIRAAHPASHHEEEHH